MSRNQLQLDEKELQILRDFEQGEFESMKHFRGEKRRLEEVARNTLNNRCRRSYPFVLSSSIRLGTSYAAAAAKAKKKGC